MNALNAIIAFLKNRKKALVGALLAVIMAAISIVSIGKELPADHALNKMAAAIQSLYLNLPNDPPLPPVAPEVPALPADAQPSE